MNWTAVGNTTTHTFNGLNLEEGVTYYANVQAIDNAGNISGVFSGDGITIDQSSPVTGQVNDGTGIDIDWVNINYLARVNWTGFHDSLSGIAEYEYSLGLDTGQTEIVDWISSGLDTSITVNISLDEGPTYYANVRAIDSVGNISPVISSDGFGLDQSVPVSGTVIDGLETDQAWTGSMDTLNASWTGFSDQHSGIEFYEYAIDSSAGGQGIVAWTSVDSATEVTHDRLGLNHGTTYYFTVRATDVVGYVSQPDTSNGITVDTIPPVINLIAEAAAEDPLFQGSDSTVTLYWNAADDLSGVEHYEYSLGTTAGDTDLVAWASAGDNLSIQITNLALTEGASYWGSLRAFDAAGNVAEAQGNGVTIDITVPETGTAMDYTDLNNTEDQGYTGSITTLSASWSGFSDNLSGIAAYEYAAGTAALETDLKTWTAVNLDTVVTDNSFSLSSGQVYHVSVRAIDAVGNISEPISTDGIVADHEGPFGFTAADGDSIDIERQNIIDLYSGHWSLFTDDLSGLMTHEYALYDTTDLTYVSNWGSAGLDTAAVISDLNLTPDHLYQLHVRGVDQVHNTGGLISSNGVLIDLSAPEAPQDLVGFFSTERIYLTWSANTEEDLSFYKVYAGNESNATVSILETENPTAEAFMPGFQDGQPVYLNITAVDIPGNESVISNQVQGIPQPAMITHITPDTLAALIHGDNQISIHFSQPLSDIGTIDVSSLVYPSMNTAASYSEADTSIKLIVNDPWASLDTVNFTLGNILDWAGNGTDQKEINYTTYLLGDYDLDFAVDITDLSSFVSAWYSKDYNYELGPVTGTIPHFIPDRNESYDLRDIMVFTRMWHYSHQTNSNFFLVYGLEGPDLDISQEGRLVSIELPAETGAAQVTFNYPSESKTINIPEDISTANMIQLSYQPEDKGRFLMEKAFMKKDMAKQVVVEIKSLDREDAIMGINYIAYDDANAVLASGTRTIDVIAIPDEFALQHNYPNPFNPVTIIEYDIPVNAAVQLLIYDIIGRQVKVLVNESMEAGYKSVRWNGRNDQGRNVSAGMYFYSIQAGDFVKTRKMILLK